MARAAVLFSGGSDSSLCAIRMAQRFEHIELLTMTRRGLFGEEHVVEQVKRLRKFFGDPSMFSLVFLPTDRLCRHVMYERYLRNVRRHGLVVLSMCGLCKVSFHFRALVYCLEHGIEYIADGAVRVANVYPEQNETIMLNRLRELYATFGIKYETPIYEDGDRTEQLLYEMRFNPTPKIKGTKRDLQIVCEQQVLYAMFLRVALRRHSFEEFERRMAAFYKEKLAMVEEWTREWRTDGARSRLAALLQDASCRV